MSDIYYPYYNPPHNADSAKVEPISTLAKLDKSGGEWWTHEEMQIVRQALDEKDKRIAELEAALAAASQWQPIRNGVYAADHTGESFVIHEGFLNVEEVDIVTGEKRNAEIALPPEYAICRRTPAAGE